MMTERSCRSVLPQYVMALLPLRGLYIYFESDWRG